MPAANRQQPIQDAYGYPSASSPNLPTAETAAYPAAAPALEEVPLNVGQEAEVKRYPILNWKRSQQFGQLPRAGALFVHDKIYPEEFVKTLLKEPGTRQGELGFAAINGFTDENGNPAANVELHPYRYQNGHWSNRLIRSTAQRAMASLLEKENMQGKVNLVYLDPPYNISFRSNFQTAVNSPETAENLNGIPQDALSVKAFRDSYRNGIHSYLDGLHEQFTLARELLAEDGSLIIQIGPDNLHQAAMLLGEVFGYENHVATIPYRTTTSPHTRLLPEIGNWLIWYARDKIQVKYHQLYDNASNRNQVLELWGSAARYETADHNKHSVKDGQRLGIEPIPSEAKLFRTYPCHSGQRAANQRSSDRTQPFYFHPEDKPCQPSPAWEHHLCSNDCRRSNPDCPKGKPCNKNCQAATYPCPSSGNWRVSRSGLHYLGLQNRLDLGKEGGVGWKQYENEVPGRSLNAMWNNAGVVPDKQYIVETPPRVLERCLLMTTDPGDLVLDLTCGSGAMPVMAETWGRRWLAVDVSAISIAIARERIATTLYPYHILADSPEGHRLDHELEQILYPEDQRTAFAAVAKPDADYRYDPAAGFVNERQLKVSAAVLAYGPDWNEDIIRHPDRTKQDRRRKRAAAPFLVASDSPNRALTPEQAQDSELETPFNPADLLQETGFTLHLKENLELAGIKQFNGPDGIARFQVENLQPAPHRAITHIGELIAPDQSRHKACFYIADESEAIYGRTTHAAIRASRLEASIEYLVLVGFEINGDAHAAAAQYQGPQVLHVQANRDLQIPHLKSRNSDDSFTIVSEPEILIHEEANRQISLELTGLNAFNPATGRTEYSRAEVVIGIMVDTEYDGNSFRARLINVKENSRNQRTLRLLQAAFRQNIDQDKWRRMTSHRTLPFSPSREHSIAVKVIDQAGMEHMTVIQPS